MFFHTVTTFSILGVKPTINNLSGSILLYNIWAINIESTAGLHASVVFFYGNGGKLWGNRREVHDFNINYWQSGEIEKVGKIF